ncbi:MAG TPA: hypothetical protein P5044_08505, partial [bacterium]|nr:hypothetical protein [bacterium]
MNNKQLSFLIFFFLPLYVFANYSYDCNEVGSLLGLTDAADGSGNKAYDVSSNNFTGGPWYSFRFDEGSQNYVFYPLTDVFSISESNSDSIMVLNHWCSFDGELSDHYGDCECESVRNISGVSTVSDNKSGYQGVFSYKEKADRMVNEYELSVSSYGSNCLLNNATAWFRFDYAAKNPDNPLPPRLYFDQNFIKSCTYGSIYKIWSECTVHQYDEVFFDDPQNPVVLTTDSPAFYFTDHQTYLDISPYCEFFALTDDPFKNIISFSTADRTALRSETGFEHPLLEQSGTDIKISPSSQVWWSASPAYRARKLDEEKFEVVILTTPFIDECVPAGEYIYFFTDHNCPDPEAECRNYEGISIGRTVFNSECPYPEHYSVVMNYELEPLLVKKPFLSGETLPGYNNYFNSCTILPGDILKRRKLNAVGEKIQPRLIYNFEKDILKLENCSKETVRVE